MAEPDPAVVPMLAYENGPAAMEWLARAEQARAPGAAILSEVESGGPGKRYRAEDLEGHRWMFMERGH